MDSETRFIGTRIYFRKFIRNSNLLHLYSVYIRPSRHLRAIQSHDRSSLVPRFGCQVELPGNIRNAKLRGSWRYLSYSSRLRRFYRQRWEKRRHGRCQTVVECLRWLYGSWLSLEITLWGLPGGRMASGIVREPMMALRPIFQKENSGANGTFARRVGLTSDKPSKATRRVARQNLRYLLCLLLPRSQVTQTTYYTSGIGRWPGSTVS